MGLIAKSTENSTGFTQPEVGVHEARCVKVIDLGTQKVRLKEKLLGNDKLC